MKSQRSPLGPGGFSRVIRRIVVGLIGLLAMLLLPALGQAPHPSAFEAGPPAKASTPDPPASPKAIRVTRIVQPGTTTTPGGTQLSAPAFDQRVVGVLQPAIKWGYLALVLVGVMWMTFELCRRARQEAKRRADCPKRTYGRPAPVYNE